jgi:hypothetical protein
MCDQRIAFMNLAIASITESFALATVSIGACFIIRLTSLGALDDRKSLTFLTSGNKKLHD